MSPAAGSDGSEERPPLSAVALGGLVLAAVLIFAALVALGTWQLERRVWKLDLIERVRQRVKAPAVPAPGPQDWPRVSRASDEYRRVSVAGTFLPDRETLVQATTVLGGGYWVLAPLRSGDGSLVLVNRGFVPQASIDPPARVGGEPRGVVTVNGLLRMTEPGGGFLRRTNAAANRWYSRDVEAIAAARGLGGAAPYFIDAEASPGVPANAASGPVGGLTVIDFANNHLVYAITWYVLALMTTAAAGRLVFEEMRRRRARTSLTGEAGGQRFSG